MNMTLEHVVERACPGCFQARPLFFRQRPNAAERRPDKMGCQSGGQDRPGNPVDVTTLEMWDAGD
jgi:hypothetical protein